VEAGLLEFFLHIDLARCLQWEQPTAHPAHLLPGHPAFGYIDGGASHVRAYDISLGRSGISIGFKKPLLVFHRPDR
jgi:hypothetical protein